MADPLPPWLDEPFNRLAAAFSAGRLAHALLIHSPGGWGETLLADALALEILGQRNTNASAQTTAHPDLRWIAPEKPGGQIRIDEVRTLGEFVVRTATAGTHKVAVIAPADAMNIHAANALLKSLEEPPAGTHLLLVATHPAGLPATIRSRCLTVPVLPAPAAVVRRWLEPLAARVVASRLDTMMFEYGNAPLYVLDAVARDEAPLEGALVKTLSREQPVLQIADALSKEEMEGLLVRWMRYLPRELARRAGFPPAKRTSIEDPLGALLAETPADQLHRFWSELAWARRLLFGTSNPNRRLLLEALLLRFRELRHGSSH